MTSTAVRPTRWRNWLGNETCDAPLVTPRGLDELASTVAVASRRGRVRCVGRGTAWSGLVATEGTLLSTVGLARILELDLDGPEPSVVVQAGITVSALTTALGLRGFALIGPTMFDEVTIGGALATGSHGVGFEAGTLADSVTAMTLVDAVGTVHHFDRSDRATLDLLKVSLGLLGAVYSVRLRVRRNTPVWVDEYTWPFEQLVEELPDLVKSYDHVQFLWFFQAGQAVVRGMRRVDGATLSTTALSKPTLPGWLHLLASTLHPATARLAPALVSPMIHVAAHVANAGRSWLGDPRTEFHLPEPPRAWSTSFGIPMDQLIAALRIAQDVARRRQRQVGDGPTFPFFARMVGASDAPLAASYGRATCFLESTMCSGSRDVAGYFDGLETALLALPGVRPHWAKCMGRPDGALARLAGIEDFKRLRDRLDPEHHFTNRFCERLLATSA